MTKFTLIGLLSCLGGGLLLGFQALSSIMHTEGTWKILNLIGVVGEKHFTWLEGASFFGLEKMADYIVNMPLFVLLFCIGGLFLVLGYFFGRK
ncbi:hypothetical protein ACFL0M_00540 [Thermodesulfobacteriota bacterium]